MRRRGLIVILSSPSGAGKTTLTRMLLQDKALDLSLSISVTTRPRRSSEVDGVHYHFIGGRQFDLLKAAGDLLESAEVHGNCYGTPREPVMRTLAEGRDVLFDIDWQGAQQVREALGADVVSVFILPPSMTELRARLDRRAEDSAATIAKRLEKGRFVWPPIVDGAMTLTPAQFALLAEAMDWRRTVAPPLPQQGSDSVSSLLHQSWS